MRKFKHSELLERTKNFRGLKISVRGMCLRLSKKRGSLSNLDKFYISELGRLFIEGREAWIKGDLEKVADMFGVLVDE